MVQRMSRWRAIFATIHSSRLCSQRRSGAEGDRISVGREGLWPALLAIMVLPIVDAAQLTATWESTATGALGFKVERSRDGISFEEIATVSATANSYRDGNLSPGSYWYRVRAFNTDTMSAYSNVQNYEVSEAVPFITFQPTSQSAVPGSRVALGVTAGGSAPLSFQWRKNGVPITGATSAMLELANLSGADAGTYTVVVTNTLGSTTSIPANLTVSDPVRPGTSESRLANVSIRAI